MDEVTLSSESLFYRKLRELLAGLSRRRRSQLALMFGLTLVSAIAEVASLGAVIPLVAILASPDVVLQKPMIREVVNSLGLGAHDDLRWAVTVLFAVAALAASFIRFLLIYVTAHLNYSIGHELGKEVFRRTIYQPYEVHVSRNSSEIVAALAKVDEVVNTLYALLNFISALLMSTFILLTLVLIAYFVAMVMILAFGAMYGVVFYFTRMRLARNSEAINSAYGQRIQVVEEALGGIRDILLDRTQSVFVKRFSETDWNMRQADASNLVMGPSPRIAAEAVGMVLIAFLAYYLTGARTGFATALPILGAITLGAQRLLPLMQQIYQGWVTVNRNRLALYDVVDLLQQPIAKGALTQVEPFKFKHEIKLDRVSFRYQPTGPLVLDDFDLTIAKGARIGFVGATGSGKSTLVDLIIGLLQPSSGQVSVDGAPLADAATRFAWQATISHVPQTIYLVDGSFAENIAFGVPPKEIDRERVRLAAQRARIADFIESFATGYDTSVGERGIRLSGGQRQRVGIARALYKHASLLVFDEATSALDSDTERSVIESINNLGRDLTLLMIAHRTSTLRACDVIHKLEGGKIVRSGTYNEIFVASKDEVKRRTVPTSPVDS
jgi:ATP-binding cassette, subfamily B, bacterial PglK